MKKLPKTPSKLLAIALADLVKVEKSKKYNIRMYLWHAPYSGLDSGTCSVCLAGAVMAKTLKADPTTTLEPKNFKTNKKQLLAINQFRTGNIQHACDSLLLKNRLGIDGIEVAPYDRDPTEFKKDMRKLIKNLQKAGM